MLLDQRRPRRALPVMSSHGGATHHVDATVSYDRRLLAAAAFPVAERDRRRPRAR
jgi:hypothetical protein